MIRFIIVSLGLAAALLGGVQMAAQFHWLVTQPSFLYQTVIFLLFSTAVIYTYLYKASKPEFFVQLYLLTMAVKILGYGVYVYFIIVSDRPGCFLNVSFFLIAYLLFTVLEIVFLYLKNSAKHTA